MSDAKTLDKVVHLIALASSPSEEEARTSAVLACRLIREHGFLVVMSNGAPSPAARTARPAPPRSAPQPRPAPAPKRSRRPQPRLIVLNYRGVCVTCERYITRGDRAWWRPGKGVVHEGCNYDSLY